jgi:AraC-like DNA-binding protein
MLRMRAFIEENLSDVDLSTALIAAAHHLSERQVQRLFAAERTTVDGWIRGRRLERHRADPANPTLSGRTVSEIAARWG